jgi:predicted ArsR family transcriptional regulator
MGRPTYVYELVDSVPQVFKRSYSAFVDTIIQQMKALDEGKKPEELFDRLRETRDQQYIAHTNGETLTDRVACLAQLMESEGRMTTWQQINENQFILREHNCPFYRFNGRFDHPCRSEISLLKKTLKAQVKRVNHILEGDVACVYEIVGRSNGQHFELGQRGHAAPAKYMA